MKVGTYFVVEFEAISVGIPVRMLDNVVSGLPVDVGTEVLGSNEVVESVIVGVKSVIIEETISDGPSVL